MIEAHYRDIRRDINSGDIFAFGGRGFLSSIIKVGTWCHASHIGIADRTINQGRQRVTLAESTSLPGVPTVGVQSTYLSDRLDSYEGEVWWLPLSDSFRAQLDMGKFWQFLDDAQGKPYDTLQAYLSWSIFKAHEDYSKFFCSELAAAAWKHAGSIKTFNPSELHPRNIIQAQVYSGLYFQLKGRRLELNGYNSKPLGK